MSKRTVADFKRYALRLAKVKDLGEFVNAVKDKELTILRVQFVECLNNIGAQNTHGEEYYNTPNIDEKVELTDDEWLKLEAELLSLIGIH